MFSNRRCAWHGIEHRNRGLLISHTEEGLSSKRLVYATIWHFHELFQPYILFIVSEYTSIIRFSARGANSLLITQGRAPISYFRVDFCLCFKTSLRVKAFIWERVSPVLLFSCKTKSFHMKRFAGGLVLKKRQTAPRKWSYYKGGAYYGRSFIIDNGRFPRLVLF